MNNDIIEKDNKANTSDIEYTITINQYLKTEHFSHDWSLN